MRWPLHREWRSHWHDTLALLEAEQMAKRHLGSGRPQEKPRRNCLTCKPWWEPRAVPARESQLVPIQPWSLPGSCLTLHQPHRSFSLHHGPSLPSPGAAPDLWGCLFPHSASRNVMLHSKTSLFQQRFLQFGEVWISCAPHQQWDIHVLLAGQRSMGMPQGHLEKDSRYQCWEHCDQETLLDVLWWPHTSGLTLPGQKPLESTALCSLLTGLKPWEATEQQETHSLGMSQWFKLSWNVPKSLRIAQFNGINCPSTSKDSSTPIWTNLPRAHRHEIKTLNMKIVLGFEVSPASPLTGIRKCKEVTVEIKLSFFSESYLNLQNLMFIPIEGKDPRSCT